MKEFFNIIVLASGNGTNLGAILDAKRNGQLSDVQLLGVISNHKASGALEKARDFRHEGAPSQEEMPHDMFIGAKGKTTAEYDREIMNAIDEMCQPSRQDQIPSNHKVDLVCLIGYMRILSPAFIKKFKGKIINVHPSLLPKYGGKGMFGNHVHQAVLDAGDIETGMTIHYVDEGVDTGEIILQTTVPVESGDTVDGLKAKVQEQEKIGYVQVLTKLSLEKQNEHL